MRLDKEFCKLRVGAVVGVVSGAPNQCNSNPSGDVGNSLPWETLPLHWESTIHLLMRSQGIPF